MSDKTATLAGGCFWCLEAVFEMLRGVRAVKSGYTGGARANPTYEQVCSGATGHAEAVQVTYTPSEIGYRDLLDVFFTIHDPTTLNRQGADVGTQYRSAIFHHDADQRRIAEQTVVELQADGPWDDPIVTEIVPFETFYPAEPYHDEYYRRNPNQGYCRVVIAPKVAKARRVFLDKLKRTD